MPIDLLGQYLLNTVMLGLIYALVAVGFTLFFGVMNIIQFSHGDIVMMGAFMCLYLVGAVASADIMPAPAQLIVSFVFAAALLGFVGIAIGRFLVLPMKDAPPLNVLLITLMLGTIIRECVRLFVPGGSNPIRFPPLLSTESYSLGKFTLRLDSALMLIIGAAVLIGTRTLIKRTKLGLAIQAVGQDEETARILGIDDRGVVLATFAIGAGLAAVAGVFSGLYYNQINFDMGLLLGVIGFSSAIVGGLGALGGAVLGGLLFASLQTFGTLALPIGGEYKDIFAFTVVIAIMTWRPTGLLGEKYKERV